MKQLITLLIFVPLLMSAQTDSTRFLLVDYYRLVRQNHPIAKQAELIRSRGTLAVSQARGAFDPKLISDYNAKQFEDKNYYDLWNSYVEIPTLLNVDLKAGYERNSGVFLNPERNVPSSGLYYAGVSVPIGEGLFVNQRSIDLKKSKLTEQELQMESEMVLNNLFLDANFAYWHWYEAYQKLAIVRSNLALVRQRFDGIREGVLNGANAAIDSVETLIQVQQWSNFLQKAEVEYQNSLLLMQNFIWENEGILISSIPSATGDEVVTNLTYYTDYAFSRHPELRKLSISGAKLDLDRRLSAEQLKPTIDLNYNALLSESNSLEESAFLSNNYKAGVNFSFPLLIRKERAKLKMTKIKREENDLKLNQKRRTVTNKVEQSYNKVLRLQTMITQQEIMIQNYEFMLQGERIKFGNGESSIFLINSRENKKLDAEIKLVELRAELGQSIGVLKWSSGILAEEQRNLD
ncbi:MAG: TolC family protein [Cyclobacteriaceae bacterium]